MNSLSLRVLELSNVPMDPGTQDSETKASRTQGLKDLRMTSPHVLEPGTKSGAESELKDRLSRHPVVAGLTAGLAPLVGVPPGRVELAGLGGPRPAVLAGDPARPSAPALPGRLGGRSGLLGPLRAVGSAHRSLGLAGLAGHGVHLLALVAGVSRPGTAGRVPARDPPDDGRADPLGRHGVHPGPPPDRVPLVLPGPQPVPLPDL